MDRMAVKPRTILIVDDDATLRGALESVLAPLGYRVLCSGNPEGAYDLLAGEAADAVLLDVRLPTMSGLALYLAIVHRWPALEGRIAIMTGDADAADVRPWLELHHCAVFRKPFRFELLASWLEAVFQPQRRSVREG
jgi:DNA-binding NtrC family response regulator